MSLPKVPSEFESVEVGGAMFDVRSIKAGEAAKFQKMQDSKVARDELEMYVIAAATDTPLEEVREWYVATDRWVIDELIPHIKRISRLDEEAQKSGGESDSPGGG